METDFAQSIVLITSKDLDNGSFGTGFAVHRQEQETFIVTCAHVIKKVGGCEQVSIYGHAARQIASGEAHNIDVAVISVTGLSARPPLPLRAAGTTGDAFTTAGFQFFDQGFLLRPLQGTLGAEVGLEFRNQDARIPAWDVKINDEHFDLQQGYSGSPIVHPDSRCVFGVASHKLGSKKGLAISIEALKTLWPDIPATLFAPARQTPTVSSKPSAFAELKRKTLEDTLADLCKKYELAHAQIMGTLSAADKTTLHNQIRLIENEIIDLETQLQQL